VKQWWQQLRSWWWLLSFKEFWASNLKRAAFFFDYKEFLANGGRASRLAAAALRL